MTVFMIDKMFTRCDNFQPDPMAQILCEVGSAHNRITYLSLAIVQQYGFWFQSNLKPKDDRVAFGSMRTMRGSTSNFTYERWPKAIQRIQNVSLESYFVHLSFVCLEVIGKFEFIAKRELSYRSVPLIHHITHHIQSEIPYFLHN